MKLMQFSIKFNAEFPERSQAIPIQLVEKIYLRKKYDLMEKMAIIISTAFSKNSMNSIYFTTNLTTNPSSSLKILDKEKRTSKFSLREGLSIRVMTS